MRKYCVKESKMIALDDSIDYLKRVIAAIQEVQDGFSESEVCRKYDIDKNSFRRLIFNEKLGYKGELLECLSQYLMSPEEQLYCEVFQQKDLLDVEIPLDLVNSVKFVAKSLSKRERRILFFRYWRNYMLKEIGEKLGVTKERARQWNEGILRKLRYSDSAKILCYGLEYWNKEQELRKDRMGKFVTKLQEQYTKAITKNDVETIAEIYYQCKEFLEKPSTTVNEVSIEAVGFSARTCNVLCRNGIATIGELSKFKTMEHLMILPGVGRKVAKEIQRKADLYQIQIRENDKKTTAL